MTIHWNYDELRPHMGLYPVPKEFATWYPLPGSLQQDLKNYDPNGSGLEAREWPQFERILAKAFIVAHQSVLDSKPVYHNLRHFVEIVDSGKELLHGYEKLTENELDNAVKQAFLFGLALHDCGHSGCTFRSHAPEPKKLFRAEEGVNVSTEFVSMIEADEQAKQFGFNPPARLFISYVIASSTFGGKTSEGRRIGIEHIEPNDLFGCMVQLADVRPKSMFSSAVLDDLAVMLGENPLDSKPKTAEEMIPTREVFLAYVESRMDKVDQLAGVKLTDHLGWRQQFAYRKKLPSIGTSTMEGAVNGAIFEAVFRSYTKKCR